MMITSAYSALRRLGWAGALALALAACGQTSLSADEHIARAQQAYEQGELRTAMIEIKNALKLEPSRAEARRLLGMYSLEAGDAPGAEGELARALELGADPEAIRLPLARARLQQGETEEVLAATEHIDQIAGEDRAEALALRGRAMAARGELDAARETLNEALALEPKQAEALLGLARLERLSGDTEQTRKRLDEALAADPAYDPAWELLGDLELEAGHAEAAESAYTKALETSRHPFGPRFKRALVRIDQDDFDGAGADLDALQKAFGKQAGISYGRGLLAFRQQRYDEARPELEEALSLNPSDTLAMFFLGATHFALGNTNQAENLLARVVSRVPGYAPASRLLAATRLKEGDAAGAESTLKAALAQDADDTATLTLLSDLYLNQGRTEDALQQLRRAAELDPDAPLVQARLQRAQLQQDGGGDDLQRLQEAITREFPEQDPEAVIEIVRRLRAGEHRQALEAAEQLRGDEGDASALYFNLTGVAHLGLGDNAAAEAAFREGLTLAPDNITLAMNLARLQLRQGEREAAAQVLEGLQAAHPDHLPSALLLAQLALEQGDTAGARTWLTGAVEHHPDNAALHYQLARVQAADGDDEATEQSLRRVLELAPDDVPARVALVRLLSLGDRTEEARRLFQPLVDAHGDRPDVLAQQGWFAARDGEYDAAAGYYERALESAARRPWVIGYHEALTQAGRVDDAVANLRGWLEKAPDDSAARHLLAMTLTAAGRDDEAAAVYREQLQRQAEDVVALNNLAWMILERDTDQAIEYARKAGELAPDRGDVQDTLGMALLRGGDTAGAVAALQRAYALAPEIPVIGYHLSQALQADEQPEEARKVLTTLLDRDTDFAERAQAEALLEQLQE